MAFLPDDAGDDAGRPTRTRRTLVWVIAAVVVLAGVAGTAIGVGMSLNAGLHASSRPTASASTGTASSAAPVACSTDAQPIQGDESAAGEQLQIAARAAVLPASVVLGPTFAVTRSAARPDGVDAVIAVCSDAITRDELISVGTQIAVAIDADPHHAELVTLEIVPWTTIDPPAIAQDAVIAPITTDFSAHDWTGTASALRSAWQ